MKRTFGCDSTDESKGTHRRDGERGLRGERNGRAFDNDRRHGTGTVEEAGREETVPGVLQLVQVNQPTRCGERHGTVSVRKLERINVVFTRRTESPRKNNRLKEEEKKEGRKRPQFCNRENGMPPTNTSTHEEIPTVTESVQRAWVRIGVWVCTVVGDDRPRMEVRSPVYCFMASGAVVSANVVPAVAGGSSEECGCERACRGDGTRRRLWSVATLRSPQRPWVPGHSSAR